MKPDKSVEGTWVSISQCMVLVKETTVERLPSSRFQLQETLKSRGSTRSGAVRGREVGVGWGAGHRLQGRETVR